MSRALALLLALFAIAPAAAGLRGRCRRMCRSEVARCRAAGFRRASCRQELIADCIASGASICMFLPATSTTTTTPPFGPTTTAPSASTTTTTLPAVSTGYYTFKDTTGSYILRFYLDVQGGIIVGGWVNSQIDLIDLGHSVLTTSALTLQTIEDSDYRVWWVNVSLPSMIAEVIYQSPTLSTLRWSGTVMPGIQ